MKKLTLLLSIATLILLLTGCNPMQMATLKLDPRLPKLQNVKAIAQSTSVGFEWQPMAKMRIDGVNIYRTDANAYAGTTQKQLTKIGTVLNPFASHFVDTGLKQNSKYTYTFTTIRGEYESSHGEIIEVKTKPYLPPITFFQGKQLSRSVIKLLWRPHSDKRIKMYRVERSVNGGDWKWVKSIHSRIMVEYIDIYVKPRNRYQYRVTAIGFDDSYSKPSKIVTIDAR